MDAGSHAYPTPSTIRRRVAARGSAASRTLTVAASATLLVLATFGAIATTIGDSARTLGSGVGGETWALSGMSLGLATALLTVGVLADDLGRRRVMVWSLAALAVASALGALAPDMAILVAARVLQGAAGAGVLASSLGAIGHTFPAGRERTHATGVWGATLGGGIAIGPPVAAWLAAGLGWRSSYWLEAGAALALLPTAARLSESRADSRRALDLPGVVTLGSGMAAVTAGIVEGRTSWSAPATIGLLVAGVALLVAFGVIELRSRRPMVELRLLAEPLFAALLTGSLFTGVAIIGLISFVPTVAQRVLGTSVVGSAGVIAIWAVTSMVVSLVARRLPAAWSSRNRLASGLALSALGEALLALASAGDSWASLAPGLLIAGVGSGIANAAVSRLAVEAAPSGRASMSSGASNTARYLGGAAGVALVAAIATRTGAGGLAAGWDTAAIVSGALCGVGAAIVAWVR
jgi:MFS family permease